MNPEQSNPGIVWPPSAAGAGRLNPHSPPHTYGYPANRAPHRTSSRRASLIRGSTTSAYWSASAWIRQGERRAISAATHSEYATWIRGIGVQGWTSCRAEELG
ncbi:MAG: hypothetical protein KatS3mg013_1752 [Actinomycetota bacterium]|nr:MAG: hypothetical protein KatS3mg013_1752 [Actinomycetota bacterium]